MGPVLPVRNCSGGDLQSVQPPVDLRPRTVQVRNVYNTTSRPGSGPNRTLLETFFLSGFLFHFKTSLMWTEATVYCVTAASSSLQSLNKKDSQSARPQTKINTLVTAWSFMTLQGLPDQLRSMPAVLLLQCLCLQYSWSGCQDTS